MQRPGSKTQRPASSTQRPATNTSRVAANVQRSLSSLERPAGNAPPPVPKASPPVSNAQRSLANRKRPVSSAPPPVPIGLARRLSIGMERHFYSNLLLICIGVWFLFVMSAHVSRSAGSSLPPAPAPAPVPVKPVEARPIPLVEIQRQFDALEQDKRAVEEKMDRLKAERNKRARAAAKTSIYREALQVKYQSNWTDLLAENWETYQDLRAKARFTSDRTTPCTICDGRGKLNDPCFVCAGSSKCPTCAGSGKLNNQDDEICPTCLGASRCFFCGGGKLNCPYCDDGQIYYDAKFPPLVMPIK